MSALVFWPIVIGIIVALIIVFLMYSLKVIKQYERGVAFRFGHLRPLMERIREKLLKWRGPLTSGFLKLLNTVRTA